VIDDKPRLLPVSSASESFQRTFVHLQLEMGKSIPVIASELEIPISQVVKLAPTEGFEHVTAEYSPRPLRQRFDGSQSGHKARKPLPVIPGNEKPVRILYAR